MSGGKFNFNILRDYFLKTNVAAVPLDKLKRDEIVNLAILSVFDTKGVTVKNPGYSYEKPDGTIDKAEFSAVTEKQYKQAVKDIQKVIKKQMGNDYSNLKIPTYEELNKMIADGKIDVDELSGKASIQKPLTPEEAEANKSRFIQIPKKAESGELSEKELTDWFENMNFDVVSNIYNQKKNGTYNYKPAEKVIKRAEEAQTAVDAFMQNDDKPTGVQIKDKDSIVYNANGQRIRRANGVSNVYESFKYENAADENYSEMMKYRLNGYKHIYIRRESLTDEKGNVQSAYVAYALDENEKIYKIHMSPEFQSKEFDEFNNNNEYERSMRYFKEAGYSDEDIEALLNTND